MAGPQNIQRVPQGLLNLLSMAASGETPDTLAGSVSGTLELLQYYGLTQRQTQFVSNAALAENAALSLPAFQTWAVLFGATFSITKTATMTAARGAVLLTRGAIGSPMVMVSEELGPFGATDTGVATAVFWAPYPLLVPPLSVISGLAQIIGTDATANCTLVAEIGLLG